MLGFIDLSSLAIAAGYKLRAKNMTAMGVQVMGTILNKCVSTGDDQWGQIWSHIPAALQVYALGDIKFGFITYNVLAGILIRDLFPDPEILCKLLECSQKTAVEWILEWFVKSLEGVESHQDAEEQATDRVSLMKTLRFRNSRNKLEKTEPPYVLLFSKLLGDWPTITKGGCRYLIPARIKCIKQLRLLARANIKWHKERIIIIPSDEDLNYTSFSITGEIIQSQDWLVPINQIEE